MPVQGDEGLARLRRAHTNLMFFQHAIIECVQRLSALQHHIVGDIHHIVDGPHAAGIQPRGHPVGRRLNGDVFQHAARIAVTVLRTLDCYLHTGSTRAFASRQYGFGSAQGHSGYCADLARQADDAQTVRPVRGNKNIKHKVLIAHYFFQVRAWLHIYGQDHEAFIALGQSQFRLGTEHAGAGDSMQMTNAYAGSIGQRGARQRQRRQHALGDIRRSADHLHRRGPGVHLAQPSSFCVLQR
ncbi:MAG: hypothetical protein BWY83_03025 [bacterium ADurb.Bin478]|nr:MAG: hypothetical protein BWY83_03025 [bacterium ADurb.Bin478]